LGDEAHRQLRDGLGGLVEGDQHAVQYVGAVRTQRAREGQQGNDAVRHALELLPLRGKKSIDGGGLLVQRELGQEIAGGAGEFVIFAGRPIELDQPQQRDIGRERAAILVRDVTEVLLADSRFEDLGDALLDQTPFLLRDERAGLDGGLHHPDIILVGEVDLFNQDYVRDRKSTRLNSSHVATSYAVF